MNPTKNLVFFAFAFLFLRCSSYKEFVFEEHPPIHISHVYYYDWTTDIKIGSAGTNIFLANLSTPEDVIIDRIFFKNMIGKLNEGRSMYYAQMIRMLPNSEGNKVMAVENFPFELSNSECVVSYISKDGKTGYFKVNNVQEKAGVHYLEEPPKELYDSAL